MIAPIGSSYAPAATTDSMGSTGASWSQVACSGNAPTVREATPTTRRTPASTTAVIAAVGPVPASGRMNGAELRGSLRVFHAGRTSHADVAAHFGPVGVDDPVHSQRRTRGRILTRVDNPQTNGRIHGTPAGGVAARALFSVALFLFTILVVQCLLDSPLALYLRDPPVCLRGFPLDTADSAFDLHYGLLQFGFVFRVLSELPEDLVNVAFGHRAIPFRV